MKNRIIKNNQWHKNKSWITSDFYTNKCNWLEGNLFGMQSCHEQWGIITTLQLLQLQSKYSASNFISVLFRRRKMFKMAIYARKSIVQGYFRVPPYIGGVHVPSGGLHNH